MLKGKKAYTICIVGTIGAVANIAVKLLQSQPIGMEDIAAVMAALGIGALRAGIKNG